MKIAMLIRALPAHRLGGLELHALDLANALAARGHELHILTSCPPERNLTDLPLHATVHHLASGTSGDYSMSFFRGIPGLLAELHARERFDAVHAQEFAGLLLPARTYPLVCHVHGTMFSEVPLGRTHWTRLGPVERLRAIWRYKARIALHPLFVRMLRRAGAIVVDSDYTRRELLRIDFRLRPRIHVVPLGIDAARYNPVPRPSESAPFTFVLLGRLQEIKGVRVALEAAQLLAGRGVDFRMKIGGSGEFAGEATRLVKEWGLGERVVLAGRVPTQEASAFLSDGDVFVFPDQMQPAFGLVAVEAMLHGLPVIAARSGAIPEVVDERCGWLYDPCSPVELADIMSRVAAQPEIVAQKSKFARLHAAGFSSARMAEEMEQVYLDTVARSGAIR